MVRKHRPVFVAWSKLRTEANEPGPATFGFARRMARNRRNAISIAGYYSSIAVVTLVVAGCNSNSNDQTNSTKSSQAKTPTTGEVQASRQEKTEIDNSLDVDALLDARLPIEDLKVGWIRLFDGQSLFGWEKTSDANWRVENETIVVDAGEKGFLATSGRFGDYEIRLEFKCPAETNSGLFLRSPAVPTSPAKDCFEVNIAPTDNPFPTGSLVERVRVEPETIGELDHDKWHMLHALVDRDHVQTWVDGHEASDYLSPNGLRSGQILLQFRTGSISFRNIRLRPIGYDILPAEDLDDWLNSNPELLKSEKTTEGGVILEGGRADLELLQQIDDSIIQFHVKTLTAGTNSGLFFRCIPGSPMDGYECQVQNVYKNDRRDPADYGTGAIFRRTKARAVLSDDFEPTFVTVQADGRHMTTWVQGIAVVNWTDDRPEAENPREGYRKEAGTLQLQGHDPGSKVQFDSLLLSPIEPNGQL